MLDVSKTRWGFQLNLNGSEPLGDYRALGKIQLNELESFAIMRSKLRRRLKKAATEEILATTPKIGGRLP